MLDLPHNYSQQRQRVVESLQPRPAIGLVLLHTAESAAYSESNNSMPAPHLTSFKANIARRSHIILLI